MLASSTEIKTAYRKLARENHPDVNAHRRDEAEAAFKEIGEAYGVLSDEQKRAMYDQYGHAGMNGGLISAARASIWATSLKSSSTAAWLAAVWVMWAVALAKVCGAALICGWMFR